MKVRNGFVSNSSSSSFIISKDYDMSKVLEYAKSMVYKEKPINDEYIKVATVEDLKRSKHECTDIDIEDWYEYVIDKFSDCDIVLYDTIDNYISESAAKKIIKKFRVDNYNLHMG